MHTHPARLLLVSGLFFVSGLTGLVYEVIWAKYLSLLLGSTAHAQMGVLAVFMGGLALGAALWGGIADRSARPLWIYGWLELVIGCSAGAFALGFDLLSHAYWQLLAHYPPPGVVPRLVQSLLCIAAMGVPTVCMGGTLPVLARAFGLTRTGFGRGVAFLYALNSAGAALGAALAGFVLVPRWGFDRPFLVAALANAGIGLLAIWLGRTPSGVPQINDERRLTVGAGTASVLPVRGARWTVPLVAALTGATAMAYEVAWIRLCSLALGSSTYSFSIMLTAFILGIAAGSFVFSLIAPARREPVRFFVGAALVSAALVLACVPFYERLPYWTSRLLFEVRARGGGFGTYQAAGLIFWVVVMLPLTFSNGLIFPALAHAAAQVHRGVSRPVSYVLAANTLGTIAGTVATALYLLPWLGLEGTFRLAAAVTAFGALAILGSDARVSWRRLSSFVAAVAAAFVAYLAWAPRWDLRLLVAGEFRRHAGTPPDVTFAEYKKGIESKLLYYRDGATATVSVEEAANDILLRVNGKTDASLAGDRETQMLLGHLPALLVPEGERALLIGFGSGMTASAAARHPFRGIDVVEISPEILEAAQQYHGWIENALADPRLALHIEDARTFLFRTPHRYAVIISEPSNPWVAGVSSLFTAEFFSQVRTRLAPGGVLVQWFHTYETNDEVVRTLLRTLLAHFPHVHLFQSNTGDLLLIASLEPLQVAPHDLARAFAPAREHLEPLGLTRAESVLSLEIAPAARLRTLLDEGPLHRDRFPILEDLAPRAFFRGEEAQLVRSLRTSDDDGYVIPAGSLPREALGDWARYARRLDLLRQANSVRLLAAWFRNWPRDPELRQTAIDYLLAEPRSLRLVHALRDAAKHSPHPLPESVRGLVEILFHLPEPPNARFLDELAPLALEAASSDGDAAILYDFAFLYVRAREAEGTLGLLDRLPPRFADAPEYAPRWACLRGMAWELLGRASAALEAYERCRPANAAEAQHVEAARKRLSALLAPSRPDGEGQAAP